MVDKVYPKIHLVLFSHRYVVKLILISINHNELANNDNPVC